MQRTFERAIQISLFTWRRATADDPVDDAERYGWWGDSFPDAVNDRIGSRLWLLRRRSLTAETERDARAFAREALQWLIDDGYAVAIEVAAQRSGSVLRLRVAVTGIDGERFEFNFDDIWQVINVGV